MKNAYVNRIWEDVKAKNANEPEFLQAVEEVLSTLEPAVDQMPELEPNAILERMVEPEESPNEGQKQFRMSFSPMGNAP